MLAMVSLSTDGSFLDSAVESVELVGAFKVVRKWRVEMGRKDESGGREGQKERVRAIQNSPGGREDGTTRMAEVE